VNSVIGARSCAVGADAPDQAGARRHDPHPAAAAPGAVSPSRHAPAPREARGADAGPRVQNYKPKVQSEVINKLVETRTCDAHQVCEANPVAEEILRKVCPSGKPCPDSIKQQIKQTAEVRTAPPTPVAPRPAPGHTAPRLHAAGR
jgi:hypothetical protein